MLDSKAYVPRTAVSIAEPESISPFMRAKHKDLDHSDSFDLDKTAKQFRASVSGRRLSGRPSFERLESAKKQASSAHPSLTSLISEASDPDLSNATPQHRHAHDSLLKQVHAWLKHEKERRAARKAKKRTGGRGSADTDPDEQRVTDGAGDSTPTSAHRRGSESSEGSVALEQLATILERGLPLKSTEGSLHRRKGSYSRGLSQIMKRNSVVSSDTDYLDGLDQMVPSCEAVLDNSKTLAYTRGSTESGADTPSGSSTAKDKEAWATFKYEIVRLTHTLRLKGWRRVPLERSSDIDVERLSGALTNAVYVVSPPKHLPSNAEHGSALPTPKKPPPYVHLP